MNKMTIVIMVIAAVGMIFGVSKQKAGKLWGKPLAVACAIIALICALSHIVGSRGPSMTTVLTRETAYQKVSAQKLAMYLAEKHAGAKALIIVQPSGKSGQARENPLVDGLKEGFGSKITVVGEVAPEIPEAARKRFMAEMPPAPGAAGPGAPAGAGGGGPGGEPGDVIPPMEFWFTPEIFDAMVEKNKDKCDLIVTTIGLPQEPAGMKFWAMKTRPKLAIVGGSVYKLKGAIEKQAIAAAVTYSPKAVYEEKAPPADIEKAFEKRFLLITPENIDKISSEFGELFAR